MTTDERWALGLRAFEMWRRPGNPYWHELSYSDQLIWVTLATALFQLGVESVPC